MAENQIISEDSHQQRGSTTSKGQSLSSGTGSMSSGTSSKPHSLKHGATIGHPSKGTNLISPDGKHHHHHHHHHHHSHSHHNNPHVIHRTTSESLRLGSDMNASTVNTGSNSPSTNSSSSGTTNCISTPQLHLSAPGSRKPKTSSFQITSVTVGNKMSADNGEDSADDLDESHTDDNSRITDLENETPSVSEDTFSKEDVFYSTTALGTAPVIPTSSQYGLVIVDPDLGGVGGTPGQTISNVHVSVTDAGINIVGPNGGKLNDADQKELQHRNERFKVVKIESTEPFKRGRWMCMDYLDHTTLQQAQATTETGSVPSTGTTGTINTNDSGVNVTENHIDSCPDQIESRIQVNFQASSASPGQTLQNPVQISASEQPPLSQTVTNPVGSISTSMPAQTLSHVPNAPSVNMQQPNIVAQSLPQGQLQQAISGQGAVQPVPSQVTSDYQNASSLQGQSQPSHFYQPPTSIASPHIHGATLPTSINMQNGVPTSLASHAQQSQQPQPQQQQQPSQQQPQSVAAINVPMAVPSNVIPTEQINVSAASSLPQPMVQQPSIQPSTNIIQQSQNITSHSAPQTQVSGEMYIQQSVSQSYSTPPVSTATLPSVSSAAVVTQDIPVDVPVEIPSTQSTVVVSPASGGSTGIVPTNVEGVTQMQQPQQQQQPPPPQGVPTMIQETAPQPNVSTISDPTAIAAAIQAQQQVPAAPPTLQTQQSVIASDENPQQPTLETDSESVSSLALALSSNKKYISNKSCTSAIISDLKTPNSSFSCSEVPGNLKSKMQKDKNATSGVPRSPAVYTNLALGNCIQKLMGASIGRSCIPESESEMESAQASALEEARGIPIPKSPRMDNNAVTAFSASPTSGGFINSPFFPGSPTSCTQQGQVACSYEPYTGINPVGGLRGIGKTNSIPVGCYAYRTPEGIEIGRPGAIAHGTTSFQHQRAGGSAGDNSASGTSAVAIDNKIEQAMDLVKSHLMIAVREEVEVLKEKISELMERINQLELENTILKANVSQETLSQLSATMQTAAAKPPQNTNTSNGPVS